MKNATGSPTIPKLVLIPEAGFTQALTGAVVEFKRSGGLLRLSFALAAHDIKARYRGSVFGPFWITLTTGALVAGMALMYSQLFHTSIEQYLPWLATGLTFWGFLSSIITEGGNAFVEGSHLIKQTSLPLPMFLWRTVIRSLYVFAHQLLIVVPVLVWLGLGLKANFVLALCGIAISVFNCTWIALVLALISARFRDVPNIVTAVLQIAMFMTPVFWRPEGIKTARFVLDSNPFYYMLEVCRRPLLGEPVAPGSWSYLVLLAAIGWTVAFVVFATERRKLVHYL